MKTQLCRSPRWIARAVILIALCVLWPKEARAQGNTLLNAWTFSDTNWLTFDGHAPIAFTNIANVPDGDGNALQLDSTNAAFLRYRIFGTNTVVTNLTVDHGTIMFWFQPNWTSTNLGGTGLEWGCFIEVGTYTTNASIGWWSLYTDPGGGNLYFAGQTNNGWGQVYAWTPISWWSNDWHFVALSYSPTNSAIYVDGEIPASGSGIAYWPGLNVLTNGMDRLCQQRALPDARADGRPLHL